MQEILYADDPIWNKRHDRAYDPRRLAWVGNDEFQHVRAGLSGKTPRPSEAVKVTYPNPQQAVLDVTLDSPGLVVLADIYYPGWELKIDGKPAPIYRVNGVMRGAAVPAGSSSAGLYLRPPVVSGRPARVDRRPGRFLILGWLLDAGPVIPRWRRDPVLIATRRQQDRPVSFVMRLGVFAQR